MSVDIRNALIRVVRATKQAEQAWRQAGQRTDRTEQMDAEFNAAIADAETILAGDGPAAGPDIPEEAVQAIEAGKKLAKKLATAGKVAPVAKEHAAFIEALASYEKSVAPPRPEEEDAAGEPEPAEAEAE